MLQVYKVESRAATATGRRLRRVPDLIITRPFYSQHCGVYLSLHVDTDGVRPLPSLVPNVAHGCACSNANSQSTSPGFYCRRSRIRRRRGRAHRWGCESVGQRASRCGCHCTFVTTSSRCRRPNKGHASNDPISWRYALYHHSVPINHRNH